MQNAVGSAKRKAGILVGLLLALGIISAGFNRKSGEVATEALIEDGYELDPVRSEGYSVCGYEGTSIVANHFFETLNEFQTTGVNNPSLTRMLKTMVTDNVVVVDSSDPKKFSESGTYSNKEGFEAWLDKTTPKHGFGLTTNHFMKYKGSNLCEIKFKDEVITEIAFPNKLDSKDSLTLPKKDEDVKLESGKVVVTAMQSGDAKQCKIVKVECIRRVLTESDKTTELTAISGMNKDDIDSAKTLDKLRRSIRARQAAHELEKEQLIKHDQNRKCVTTLEHNLALHDGRFETVGSAHKISKELAVYYVNEDGAEKVARGDEIYKLAAEETDAGRKLRRIGTAMRSGKVVEKDGSQFFVIGPDKTVVEVLSENCEMSRVFISDAANEFHPVVKADIIPLVILAAAIYFAIQYGTGTAVVSSKTDYIDSSGGFPAGVTRKRNWMRNFPGHTPVQMISIPGTHDAAARVWPGGCQMKTIPEQLDMGVRAFDLRMKYHKGVWEIFHGSVKQNHRVQWAIRDLRNFVLRNPTEFVVAYLKLENMKNALSSHEDSTLVSTLFGGSSKPWLSNFVRRHGARGRYSDVKGKIVVTCKSLHHKGRLVTALNLVCNDAFHDTLQGGKRYGKNINAAKYAPQLVSSLQWVSRNARHVPRWRRVQWNGFCYSPWLWKCNPVQGAYKFAAVVNQKVWESYLKYDSYPSTKFSGLSMMDYPGAALISRIIASNNRIGATGESIPARPRPPAPAPAPKKSCFSSESVVMMGDGSTKKMKNIVAGDVVARGGAVYFVGHRDHEVVSDFVRFETRQFGKSVSATSDHFVAVYGRDGRMNIRFGDLVGEKVLKYEVDVLVNGTVWRDEILMSSVRVLREQGLYNPYSMSGSMVVNDVVVSCHSSYVLDGYLGGTAWDGQLAAIYQWMFSPFRLIYRVVPSLAVHMDEVFPAGVGEYRFVSVVGELVRFCVEKGVGSMWKVAVEGGMSSGL